ncbi:hypothetical protein FA15DRAFT_664042 [Coprinopsis marcescibilis]|uniref:F-box domain-containing protein n=1 Tax=Coprinopsis marcescibilis TaxID=230819 RepID=A0A5C3L9J0_COPMA|nr:hypothetical protein FA15DRAFT_664042 [Coprinopsis marcescibilis]
MVSADNLNFDVLELILSFLSNKDATSVALVSRSFLAGIIPTLYKNVWYQLRESKAYTSGQITSPFAVIVKHPGLAVHVRTIDLESVPYISLTKSSAAKQPHPVFMKECIKAITLCRNLVSFKCVIPNVVQSFLMALQNKGRLQNIRVYGNITTEQTRLLTHLSNIANLAIEFPSWNLLHALPTWVIGNKDSLTSLTLYMTNDLNVETLEAVLKQVPELKGLHVVNCGRIDHVNMLNLVKHVPKIESLSITVAENPSPLPITPPSIGHLKNLAIDARYSKNPSPTPTILLAITEYLRLTTCALQSFAIKFPERKIVIGESFINALLDGHAATLKRLAFLDCGVEDDSIQSISEQCVQLERLDVAIPKDENIYEFGEALSASDSLTTIVHVNNRHHVHGLRTLLSQDDVEQLMEMVGSLQTVVSDRRVWTRHSLSGDFVHARIERRLPNGPRSLWFLPSRFSTVT